MPYTAEQLDAYAAMPAAERNKLLTRLTRIGRPTRDDDLLRSYLAALDQHAAEKAGRNAMFPQDFHLPTLGLVVPSHYYAEHMLGKRRREAMGEAVDHDMPRAETDLAVLALVPEAERKARR